MKNKSLELQKIIINSVENIEYLKTNNIKLFVSVPQEIQPPYIKLSSLSMNKLQNISNLQSFSVNLFVATNDKNNYQILEIMESLYKNIAREIEIYKAKNNDIEAKIYNVYNLNYSIEENLQNNMWYGNFNFDIDIE